LAVFDIHRDNIPGLKEAERAKINNKNAAPILIIVGTDARKKHPNWQKNFDFAQKLKNQGDKMYPGLIKGVRTLEGTYNQEYFDHALLLEFGSDINRVEECYYSGELFADVVLEVLKEEIDG
jgi:stage II sporulation protein P